MPPSVFNSVSKANSIVFFLFKQTGDCIRELVFTEIEVQNTDILITFYWTSSFCAACVLSSTPRLASLIESSSGILLQWRRLLLLRIIGRGGSILVPQGDRGHEE